MRIGIDCHNLEGQRTGVGRYVWNMLKQIPELPVTPTSPRLRGTGNYQLPIELFLYFKNEVPDDIRTLYEYSHDREDITKVWNWNRWNFRLLGGKSNALFKHWALPQAAERDKVDVLFCPNYILPIYFPKRMKTALTIHDVIYEARPNDYSWPSWADKVLLKWASKQSAKCADIIFVPSEFTKSEVVKFYNINSEKIIVTSLAPDPIFKKLDFANLLRLKPEEISKIGLANKRYILFVGSIFNRRFIPQKIQGFTQFAKNHRNFKFLIIGRNHTKPYQDIGALIARTNKELGREAIIWREYASDDELVYFYNSAFATLWLSSYEGFGLPVLESMACGTPVVTSRAGSLPEIAGDAAIYVAHPENPLEISKALARLISDSPYRNDLISRGLARAAQFSWQKCAQLTLFRSTNIVLDKVFCRWQDT